LESKEGAVMFSYVAKLHHAMVAAGFMVVCIAIASATGGDVAQAFTWGAVACGVMCGVVLALMLMEGINAMVREQTNWMHEFAQLDDEGKAAVAFMFPKIRYRMKRGVVREYWEDSNVPMETFKLFLKLSNSKYISPRRDWYTRDKPEWAWLEIHAWLLENNFIVPDSAAGSHSWLWNGNAWNHLNAYWGAGMHIPEMKDMHVFTTTPPLQEDVRGG
jgi:hypothetical protein